MNKKRETAGLVPYFKKEGIIHFYLQQRDGNAASNPHMVGFFGGHIEKGETPAEAVQREAREELGIEVSPVFFSRYENSLSILHQFIIEVDEQLSERVTVMEGEYGFWLPESQVGSHDNLIDFNRLILSEISNYLRQ